MGRVLPRNTICLAQGGKPTRRPRCAVAALGGGGWACLSQGSETLKSTHTSLFLHLTCRHLRLAAESLQLSPPGEQHTWAARTQFRYVDASDRKGEHAASWTVSPAGRRLPHSAVPLAQSSPLHPRQCRACKKASRTGPAPGLRLPRRRRRQRHRPPQNPPLRNRTWRQPRRFRHQLPNLSRQPGAGAAGLAGGRSRRQERRTPQQRRRMPHPWCLERLPPRRWQRARHLPRRPLLMRQRLAARRPVRRRKCRPASGPHGTTGSFTGGTAGRARASTQLSAAQRRAWREQAQQAQREPAPGLPGAAWAASRRRGGSRSRGARIM